jgi:hypothetical protein
MHCSHHERLIYSYIRWYNEMRMKLFLNSLSRIESLKESWTDGLSRSNHLHVYLSGQTLTQCNTSSTQQTKTARLLRRLRAKLEQPRTVLCTDIKDPRALPQ